MTRVTSQALNKSYGKERRKRCVFWRLRKTGRDDADVTWHGRSFTVRAVAIGKARLPTVGVSSSTVSNKIIRCKGRKIS